MTATPRLGIAAGNELGARAGADVARAGGNAVDACLAAGIMAWVAEPFFASVGGGGFVAVGTPDAVEFFDGNSCMPFTAPAERGQGIERMFLDYANGMYTGIGGGSVAVPGVLAAVRRAWETHGRIEWAALFAPAIRAARAGIPFPRTSEFYLGATWNEIWAKFPAPRALFAPDGRPLRVGASLVQSELGDALELIAEKGPDVFYAGEIAVEMVDAIAREGGFLTRSDLAAYEVAVRQPVPTQVFGWNVESNPPPALGGTLVIHMLTLLEDADLVDPRARLRAVIEAERAAGGLRTPPGEDPSDVVAAARPPRARRSSATTHSSSADQDGLVCAFTESNGYGSGLSVHGILLNNTLGEEELNPLGSHALPPGSRCHSNMAPTIASGADLRVGLGSPGADRITGAIVQAFLALAVDGKPLADAVRAPRAHLAVRPQGLLLCYEPGLPGDELDDLPYIPTPYDDIDMFFGGVQAASVATDGTVDAAFDPRRSGGSALV